ncbi:ABC transporter ATP-binding protein (plasmid) [Photobacterium sp. GJ3]|nr:ABC transporter ATP-binding protein [Photobacterium sp. GJ3]
MANESLFLVIWFLVLALLLGHQTFSGWLLIPIATAVIALQWWVGQTAKKSFLGAYRISHALRGQLLLDVRHQPLANLLGQRLGERIKVLTEDLKLFEDIFSHLVAELFAATVLPIAMLGCLFWLSPPVAATVTVFLLMAGATLYLAEKHFRQAAIEDRESQTHVKNDLLEYIACLPMLKSFGNADRLAAPLSRKIGHIRDSGLALEWAAGAGVMAATLLVDLSIPAALLIGSWQLSEGTLTLNAWLAIAAVSFAGTRPMTRLAIFATLLRHFSRSAGYLHQIATAPQQARTGQQPKDMTIALNQVCLSMNQTRVLGPVSMTIHPGEKVAIIGPSGAGKSSLLHLIAAFHAPTSGEITIGGLTLGDMGTNHLYRHLTYLTQDVQLMSGSLRDNLLIANPNATDSELSQVIQDAALYDLVARLPDGIDSQIGENGNRLSGGERQRLSIARALLHDARIVLMDEVTASLDTEYQAQVLTSLHRHCQDKTVITVAHRLDTIVDADRIFLMENGQLVLSGQHDVLMEESERYQAFWQAASALV